MARRKLHGIQFDNPNEHEVFHAKESWVPLVLGAIPFLLIGIVGFVVASRVFYRTEIGLYILAAMAAVAIVTRVPKVIANLDTDVIITDKRLYARTGIVDIKDQVCDLSNISDVTVDPSICGRLFDYANVSIQTFAGDQDFDLRGIAHAYEMRKAISQGADAIRGDRPRPRQRA
ncbi:MAG: PH domain-containing protein [Coriobacteriales bacterium]|nr:PH domain-containing protein [Coriobacteriales bacterium]